LQFLKKNICTGKEFFFNLKVFTIFSYQKPWIWSRIGIDPKMLDPDPESMNPESESETLLNSRICNLGPGLQPVVMILLFFGPL
jgi:hypothetical protein